MQVHILHWWQCTNKFVYFILLEIKMKWTIENFMVKYFDQKISLSTLSCTCIGTDEEYKQERGRWQPCYMKKKNWLGLWHSKTSRSSLFSPLFHLCLKVIRRISQSVSGVNFTLVVNNSMYPQSMILFLPCYHCL